MDGALDAKPAWHIAAHHANFSASAIDFAELRKRSWRAEQMVELERNAARSIYAYLSKFNRKMLRV